MKEENYVAKKKKEKIRSIGPASAGVARVADVERAKQHYRDALGLKLVGFTQARKNWGRVARLMGPIFFGRGSPPFEPAVHWLFAEEYQRRRSGTEVMRARNIGNPLEKKKPLGSTAIHRRGTLDGKLLYFHQD